MCARYRISSSPSQIAVHLGIVIDAALHPQLGPRANISISQPVPMVCAERGKDELRMAEWGFRAPWDAGKRIFNAMAETADLKPTFREAFAMRRCLMPADGFYEWPDKKKTLIHFPDNHLFCFAGLWQDNEVTMLTCAPNRFMEPIHHRMPVILWPEDYDHWLRPETPPRELKAMTLPREWKGMTTTPAGAPGLRG